MICPACHGNGYVAPCDQCRKSKRWRGFQNDVDQIEQVLARIEARSGLRANPVTETWAGVPVRAGGKGLDSGAPRQVRQCRNCESRGELEDAEGDSIEERVNKRLQLLASALLKMQLDPDTVPKRVSDRG
jgi:hypothetical protein